MSRTEKAFFIVLEGLNKKIASTSFNKKTNLDVAKLYEETKSKLRQTLFI